MINLYTIAKLKFYEIFSRLIIKNISGNVIIYPRHLKVEHKRTLTSWFDFMNIEHSGKQDQDRQVECANVHVTYLCILIKE